jgi:hypothetical protein
MRYQNEQILKSVSNTGTVVSARIDASYLTMATVQATFTDAAAAGTLKLQGSNDVVPGTIQPTNWSDIPSTTATVTAGGTACTPPTTAPFCYRWIRVVFVSSAGAGTLSANIMAVGF